MACAPHFDAHMELGPQWAPNLTAIRPASSESSFRYRLYRFLGGAGIVTVRYGTSILSATRREASKNGAVRLWLEWTPKLRQPVKP
jgi:hypothetical protein